MSSAGPTEIRVNFDALDRVAELTRDAAVHSSNAKATMASASVSPGAFGLMNAALGAAVMPIAQQTPELVGTLDSLLATISGNTQALAEGWREVETAASSLTRELTDLTEEELT